MMNALVKAIVLALMATSATAGELKVDVTYTPENCDVKAKAGDQVSPLDLRYNWTGSVWTRRVSDTAQYINRLNILL